MAKVKIFNQAKPESVGEILRILRVANDLTITDVTRKIKISQSFLSEIESGKKNISIKRLEILLNLYKFSINEMSKLIVFHYKLTLDTKSELKVYQLTLLKALKEIEK